MTKQIQTPHFLVRAMSPKGRFRRCGIDFTNTWQAIRQCDAGEDPKLDDNIPSLRAEDIVRIKAECVETQSAHLRIVAENEPDPERRGKLLRDAIDCERRGKDDARNDRYVPMLAIKEATADEIAAFVRKQPRDEMPLELQLELERSRNADLEARLMKLELAVEANNPKKPSKERP